ncbi:hypothetical protein BDI4_1080026 [Burkholderia diffusa]|nr:hypothetical protein BDI4_1080026 [Burkholderia diffusa]
MMPPSREIRQSLNRFYLKLGVSTSTQLSVQKIRED